MTHPKAFKLQDLKSPKAFKLQDLKPPKAFKLQDLKPHPPQSDPLSSGASERQDQGQFLYSCPTCSGLQVIIYSPVLFSVIEIPGERGIFFNECSCAEELCITRTNFLEIKHMPL